VLTQRPEKCDWLVLKGRGPPRVLLGLLSYFKKYKKWKIIEKATK
jgi:hypothetical protein